MVACTIYYIIDYWNDKTEVCMVLYQFFAFTSCAVTYLNLIYRKNLINEMFNDIEVTVGEREKLVGGDLYAKTSAKVEIFVKIPLIFFIGTIAFIASQSMLFNGVIDLMHGEVHFENWSLPYRYS